MRKARHRPPEVTFQLPDLDRGGGGGAIGGLSALPGGCRALKGQACNRIDGGEVESDTPSEREFLLGLGG